MTSYDFAALGFFLAAWWLLGWVIDRSPLHRHTLSAAMESQRRAWMRAMARRSVRIVDTNIISGLQNSTSFFASTALLAVGAGFGLITAADTIIQAFEASTLHFRIDRGAFYLKTAGVMALYAYAFFKFGWSYRLFNYCAVMMAAAPEAGEPGAEDAALHAAEMNIAAAGQFTAGMRAFFLAIAVLAWFLGAAAFAAATALIVAALVNRQFRSTARTAARLAAGMDGGASSGRG
ncbi:DUF599 family protein [bacterium]|nr:DUF599 family protein [bacterium]